MQLILVIQTTNKFALRLEYSLINFGKPSKFFLEEPISDEQVFFIYKKISAILRENKMVLLTGLPQSGKSTLCEKVVTGELRKFVRIYVTEHLETKSLLGNYICGEKVGEFEWREGPLSSVVKKGGILILENLQEAKEELLDLLIDILSNRFKVRSERISVKDTFRIIATYTLTNTQTIQRLQDLKKSSYEICEFKKIPVTFSEILAKYPILQNCSLISSIYLQLSDLVDSHNRDLKSELKVTVIDMNRLVQRINDLFIANFKYENPIHFAIHIKLSLVHIVYDIFLARFRSKIPPELFQKLGDIFKITANEITAYLDAYEPELTINPNKVLTKRYGGFKRYPDEGRINLEFFSTSTVGNLVECILGTIKYQENLLLVGEAGSGKTTIVQEVAKLIGQPLYVYNMSQSSDVSDLLGGFKPLNAKTYISETAEEFIDIIRKYFDYDQNVKLVSFLHQFISSGKHITALLYMIRETKNIIKTCRNKATLVGATLELSSEDDEEYGFSESQGTNIFKVIKVCELFLERLETINRLKDKIDSSLIFKFIQGSLVKALKEGHWILLDEINLTQAEVLQNILPVLEKKSIILIEKGEIQELKRHPDFKIFGCMNPGNSVGKKELPPTIRKNFLEYFVKEIEDANELQMIIKNKSRHQFQQPDYNSITELYLRLRNLATKHHLTDGFGRKPTISLRALSRAIDISLQSQALYQANKQRAVVEGLFASLCSNLSQESKAVFEKNISEVFQIDINFLEKVQESSKNIQKTGFINIEGFLLKLGTHNPKNVAETDFLMTGSVKKNLTDLLRVVCHSHYPILLEGPTSAGKTSMIKFLGEVSGNKVVRINNHQHTDLDEYVGSYSPDEHGRLAFKEGLLVEAMRKGYWIILDELNLARSEILEALNRLLDDNRELYIPEINEVIRPHQDFRIFATQNPLDYGGRKELSIAFRSRFFHFFIRDLEDADLVKIIENRCKVPESRSKKLVDIMKSLRMMRSRQNIFSGKESMITIRDLLKWGSREIIEMESMAVNGYCLLAERLRYDSEKEAVKNIIVEKTTKDLTAFQPDQLYKNYFEDSITKHQIPNQVLQTVFWSLSFTRMYSLVMMGLDQGEPILLIGETGSGKTTICELIAQIFKTKLYTVNCHQYTESSDFLGGLRPVRNKEKTIDDCKAIISALSETPQLSQVGVSRLQELREALHSKNRAVLLDLCRQEIRKLEIQDVRSACEQQLDLLAKKFERIDQLFEWLDGPLIQAMTNGGVFLIDEISLAQDSVLERLNSVLEKEKSIIISEKGDGSVQEIIAHKDFRIIATMNPSGDFGKKELTPALRNRFTEIWVEPVTNIKILEQNKGQIAQLQTGEELCRMTEIKNDFIHFVASELSSLEKKLRIESGQRIASELGRNFLVLFLYSLVSQFNHTFGSLLKPLTIRDVKSTIPFLVQGLRDYDELSKPLLADYLHILLGGFKCLDKVVAEAAIEEVKQTSFNLFDSYLPACMDFESTDEYSENTQEVKIGRYSWKKTQVGIVFEDEKYSVQEDVVRTNLKSILMALSLQKSVMLEGPPGVGKTSLVQYLAHKVGVKFYRVNLNEQTDLIDLLGSDIPSDSTSIFSWADGVLVRAMKEGAWLLLDELNMATQTVLEGLNSILDHRGAIYIPELDTTITKSPDFRIFASQNPISMGSGRKGLPHSFITRFTRVWIEELSRDSLQSIINRVYPFIRQSSNLSKLVDFFFKVKSTLKETAHGVWEFNLRDLHKMIEVVMNLHRKRQPSTAQTTDVDIDCIQTACRIFVLDRIDDPAVSLELRNIFAQVFDGINFDKCYSSLLSRNSALPQYLNTSSATSVSNIMVEPLLETVEIILQTAHPILFIYDSRDETSFINIACFIESLAAAKRIEASTISLFSTSDLMDLIGSYDQPNDSFKSILNPESANQEEKRLFTWIESDLLKSMKKGSWSILKGCEGVNPAILERLNGMLEDESVVINEATTHEGVTVVKKHPLFRIFILFDKGKGKTMPSRALRNRCVEIYLPNYEFSKPLFRQEDVRRSKKPKRSVLAELLEDEICLDKIVKSAVKLSSDPLNITNLDLFEVERFIQIERFKSTIEIFATAYSKFLEGTQPQTLDMSCYQKLTQVLQLLSNKIIKTVHYRANFNFGHIHSKPNEQTAFLLPATQQMTYSEKHILEGNLNKIFAAWFKNHLALVSSRKPSLFLGLSAEEVINNWLQMANSIMSENTREEIEEGLTFIDSSQSIQNKQLALAVCTNLNPSNKHFPKFFSSLITHLKKAGKPQDLTPDIISSSFRELLTSGGFTSSSLLCCSLLLNMVCSTSTNFTSIIDRTGTAAQTSGTKSVWSDITKLFSKKSLLKLKIILSSRYTDPKVFKDLKDCVAAGVEKGSTDEQSFSKVLSDLSELITTESTKVFENLISQFISFSLLDPTTLQPTTNLVLKASSNEAVDYLIAMILKNKHIDEAFEDCPTHADIFDRISNHLSENYIHVREAIRQCDEIHKVFSMKKVRQLKELLQGVSKLFKVQDRDLSGVCRLIGDMYERKIKRLAKSMGKLEIDQFKVCDISILERLETRLEDWSQALKSLTIEEFNSKEKLETPEQLQEALKTMEEICLYAENPNHNAFMNLIECLAEILSNEDQLMADKSKSHSERKFASLLHHTKEIKEMGSSIQRLGSILKSQKTRQLSRFHFETESLQAQSEDISISYFVAKTVFRLLTRTSSFLPDSDVQEMKKLTRACRGLTPNTDPTAINNLIVQSESLLQGFIDNGSLVTFGDFLIPFLGRLSATVFTFYSTHPVTFPSLSSIRTTLSEVTNLKRSNEFSYLASACIFTRVYQPLYREMTQIEGYIVVEKEKVDRIETLVIGRSFDEASRMKNLAKGIEKAVKDEYTKETVEKNREEIQFELKRIFGIEEELRNDPKYSVVVAQNRLRQMRMRYLTNIVSGVFLRNRSRQTPPPMDPDLAKKAFISLLYFTDENVLDLSQISRGSICTNFCEVLKAEFSNLTKALPDQENRKTLMLEHPYRDLNLASYEAFWLNQIKEFIYLESNSFYKGSCNHELKSLKVLLYALLEKIQELKKIDDLAELPAFNNILNAIEHTLSLPLAQAKLNEVCLLVEKLSTYFLDYESITPKRYHFPELRDQIKDCLFEYRKKERKSWRGLVFCQGLDAMLLDMDSCIQFKSVLITELAKSKEDLSEKDINRKRAVLDLVDAFLLKSNLIQHLFRLFWVCRVLHSIPTKPKIFYLIEHVVRFHLMFVPSTLEIYQANFESVAQPIKDNEKLSNWHMKDLVNIKMNVQKFHKGIARAMKIHKEVLEISSEGTIYKRKRDAYNKKDLDSAVDAFKKAGLLPGESPEATKKPTLPKKVIDAILAPFPEDSVQHKIVQSNIRLSRLLPISRWLPLFSQKPKEYLYKNYEGSIQQAESFISDWMSTVEGLKGNQSRSNRFRVLDGYLKLLFQMGIRERTTIENWDPVKTFSLTHLMIDQDHFKQKDHQELAIKTAQRIYEMVDLLYINKSNVSYHADVPALIRRKMQAYLVSLLSNTMTLVKYTCRALRELEAVKEQVSRNNSKLGDLTKESRKRFDTEHSRLALIAKMNRDNGLFTSNKIRTQLQAFDKMNDYSQARCSVDDLSDVLVSSELLRRPLAEYPPEVKAQSTDKLCKIIQDLQASLRKDVDAYDLRTKKDFFIVSAPFFLKGVPARLSKVARGLSSTCLHGIDPGLLGALDHILEVISQHSLHICSSSVKFAYLTFRVLHNLIYEGLCVKKDDDDPNQEEGSSEYDFGTGVGEGKGDENKTDKYEYEEQLLGEKNQQEDGDSQEDSLDEDANKDDGSERNESGGDAMSMENDFEGDNEQQEKKEGEDKDKQEEEEDKADNEFDDVEEDKIDQDLWDKENEDMDEESQEEPDRREAEEKEYKGDQKEEAEQKAKEPNEKEKRNANDYEEQEDKPQDAEDQDSKKDEDEGKSEEGNSDEFAEVEDRSAMSSRNENQDMDFQSEQPEEAAPDQEQPEDFSINEQQDDIDEEDDQQPPEDLVDPLDQEERKLHSESEEDPLGDEVEKQGKDGEGEQEERPDDHQQTDNNDTKDNNSKKDAGLQAKDSPDDQQLDEQPEPAAEDDPASDPPKDKEAAEKSKLEKQAESDAQREVLEDEDNDDGGEGLERADEGEVVRVKEKREQFGGKTDSTQEKVQVKTELPQPDDKEDLGKRDPGDLEDQQKAEDLQADPDLEGDSGDQADQESGEAVPGEQPIKKLKQEEQPDPVHEHPLTVAEVSEYLKLVSEDHLHISASNTSWSAIEPLLRTRAYNLCEELRNIFKPTKISGLRGDYRSGKRLNMRKVISYVASNYRKDKIWLRRAEPNQRDYEIILAIDDTLSMSEKNVGYLALESLITLALAMTRLEVGRIAICGIRNGLHEVLPFDRPFLPTEGQRVLDEFSFKYSSQQSADLGLPLFLAQGLAMFTSPNSKLMVVVSDGRCNKELVRPLCVQAEEMGVLVVYIILDRKDDKSSVLKVRSTYFYEEAGVRKLKIREYMEDFPFKNYMVVQDIGELTGVIVDIFRDYFGRLDN